MSRQYLGDGMLWTSFKKIKLHNAIFFNKKVYDCFILTGSKWKFYHNTVSVSLLTHTKLVLFLKHLEKNRCKRQQAAKFCATEHRAALASKVLSHTHIHNRLGDWGEEDGCCCNQQAVEWSSSSSSSATHDKQEWICHPVSHWQLYAPAV